MKSTTLNISINAGPEDVYRFVSNLANLPKWAASFAKSIEKAGEEWLLETDQGPVKVRMCPENCFGILDHFVSPAPGVEIYVPMRVVANGEGSEILFTLFQHPGMTDEQYAGDMEMVRRDLSGLKWVMEESR